jgi:cyanophycinase
MLIPKGKLIPIGGGEAKGPDSEAASSELRQTHFFTSGILEQFLHEVKGTDSIIEIIPAASELPKEMGQAYIDAFRKLGCRTVHVMNFTSPEEADQATHLKRIKKADGVLFTGGDQDKLVNTLLDSQLLQIIQDRYMQEDFVIAGTSAGAAAMPRLALKEGKSAESLIKGLVETEKGLSLLSEAIIDTHFMQRSRLPRLVEALLRNPGLFGIGLCVDTGVVITEGNCLRAIGSGGVFIVETDAVKNTNYYEIPELQPVCVDNLRIHILAAGATYQFRERVFSKA